MIDQASNVEIAAPSPGRLILLALGYLSFATGFLGLFLPVLPTTVFWIVAAICFAKSSPAMYRRILDWPGVGPIIGDILHHGIIRRRSKIIALAGMVAGAMLILFVGMGPGPTAAALGGIACAAIYVGTRPSTLISE